MKAAVCRAFNVPLRIEELNLAPPGPDELEVAIAACAVCHSDVSYSDGIWGGVLPAVFGHEAAGTVVATGRDVTGFAPGDRVLVTLIRACGSCSACVEHDPTSCDHARDDFGTPLSDLGGVPVTRAMATGGFAERVVVHPSQCVSLPDDLPFETASLLACGVITGVGAVVNTARVRPGQSVAVIGAGGVGLNAIQGAAIAGANPIIALDLAEEKLATAHEFGATAGVLATDPVAMDRVRALTNGRGVDFAFVTVGAGRAFGDAYALLAPRGALVAVGMPPSGLNVPYEPATLAAMNHRIIGSRMGQTDPRRDIPRLIERWRDGRLKLEPLISGRYRLEEINDAFAATRSGLSRRNVIVFGEPA